MFTKIDVGVGVGFGLFAIFSILRFRAQTFTINAIIFLFTTITLSILDIMYPFEKFSVLLLFQSIILGFYILITSSFISQETKYVNSVVLKMSYENDFILDNNNIRNSIQNKININEFDFKIISIDAMTNEIEVKILY